MRIAVTVKPKSSRNAVEPQADGSLLVRTTAAPEGGKANAAVINLLAGHFSIAKSQVVLLRGAGASKKQFAILI